MKEITIFGWKREYLKNLIDQCELLAKKLASCGYTIVTGGGGGFMQASNKGAYSVDPKLSKGITVSFLDESANNYLNENIVTHNFQDRKDLLNKNKVGYVFCPGGMGTLDEFTELLNLYKTEEISLEDQKPICLFGTEYWNSLKEWFLKNTYTWPEAKITIITDDMDEIVEIFKK